MVEEEEEEYVQVKEMTVTSEVALGLLLKGGVKGRSKEQGFIFQDMSVEDVLV